MLELAIACEVMVKRRFFAEATPSGAAFDYLEDKSKVHVRVMELLDAVAAEAFSRSYHKEQPSNFLKIDYLFRCRNKIAHRGVLAFRTADSTWVAVDKAYVESWWHAVVDLKQWLDGIE